MKIRRQLEALEPMILGRLHGVSGDDWHAAPRGRWSVAQLLHHVAVSTDAAVEALERHKDHAGRERRATPGQHLARHVLLGVGRFPPGRKAPRMTLPDERPDPELAKAQLRMAVQRLAALATELPVERQERLFVPHPVIGDLNFPEWIRFLYIHNRHHAHQMTIRLRWLKRRARTARRRGPRGRKG
jgi:hypothetical protein